MFLDFWNVSLREQDIKANLFDLSKNIMFLFVYNLLIFDYSIIIKINKEKQI